MAESNTFEPMWSAVFVSAYLLLMLAGSFRKKSTGRTDDYLLAGRRLTLFPFVATMVTTAYGWILGIGELYYTYGVSAWLFLSLPYSCFALFMSFVLSARIRKEELRSVPELLEKYYGKTYSRIGALAVLLMVSPAMYLLMGGQILHSLYTFPVWVCTLIVLVCSSAYLYRGGFESIARKDSLKFLFMFGCFALVLTYLFTTHGPGPLAALPQTKLVPDPGNNLWQVITWFVLASLVLADPGYHQRIYSTSTPGVARKGLLISVLCWTLFDFLAAGVAMYGLALIPESPDAATIYPQIASKLLPPGMQAVFVVGMLATVMSTIDSYLFISAQSLMIDLLGRKEKTQVSMVIGLLVISVACMVLLIPYYRGSAVQFFFDFTPYVVCVLVLPVTGALFPSIRLKPLFTFLQSGGALLVYVLWNQGWIGTDSGLNAVIPAFGMAVVLHVVFVGIQGRGNTFQIPNSNDQMVPEAPEGPDSNDQIPNSKFQ